MANLMVGERGAVLFAMTSRNMSHLQAFYPMLFYIDPFIFWKSTLCNLSEKYYITFFFYAVHSANHRNPADKQNGEKQYY